MWRNRKEIIIMVINNDVEIKDRLTAVKINKHDFIKKFFEYVTSERILEITKNRGGYVEDIIDEIAELNSEKDIKIRTMDAIRILLDANIFMSVNGYWISNSGIYGYNSLKDSNPDIADFLSTETCDEGLYTFENGVTMWFASCFEDETKSYTNIAIYYDGIDFKIYVPVHGNHVSIIYKMPIGLGNDNVSAEYKEAATNFVDMMKNKISKETYRKVTEALYEIYDDDEIEEMMIDVMYLAKYNKYFDEDMRIRDITTNEKDEAYDVDAITDEIKLVFGINTETKEMDLFKK